MPGPGRTDKLSSLFPSCKNHCLGARLESVAGSRRVPGHLPGPTKPPRQHVEPACGSGQGGGSPGPGRSGEAETERGMAREPRGPEDTGAHWPLPAPPRPDPAQTPPLRPKPWPRPSGSVAPPRRVARGSDVTARWRRLLQAAEGGFRPGRSESIRGGERASGVGGGRSRGGGARTVPSAPY